MDLESFFKQVVGMEPTEYQKGLLRSLAECPDFKPRLNLTLTPYPSHVKGRFITISKSCASHVKRLNMIMNVSIWLKLGKVVDVLTVDGIMDGKAWLDREKAVLPRCRYCAEWDMDRCKCKVTGQVRSGIRAACETDYVPYDEDGEW